jgi:uncharacterized protein
MAMIAARLSDVAPDGRVTRVTYGLLHLTHRDSHASPEPLEPGRSYRVRIRLNDIGQLFGVGHRVRLALSTSYWPIAWPSPESATLTVTTGESALHLPVRASRAEDGDVRVLMPADDAVPPRPASTGSRRVTHDHATGEVVLEVVGDRGTHHYDDIDLQVTCKSRERYSYRNDDPASARGEIWRDFSYRRGDWNVAARTRTVLTSNSTHFQTHAEVEAFEGDDSVFQRTYTRSIERDLV